MTDSIGCKNLSFFLSFLLLSCWPRLFLADAVLTALMSSAIHGIGYGKLWLIVNGNHLSLYSIRERYNDQGQQAGIIVIADQQLCATVTVRINPAVTFYTKEGHEKV